MSVCALELRELLELMAADVDNDAAFFRVETFYTEQESLYADGHPFPQARFIGAFNDEV